MPRKVRDSVALSGHGMVQETMGEIGMGGWGGGRRTGECGSHTSVGRTDGWREAGRRRLLAVRQMAEVSDSSPQGGAEI